MHEPCEPGEAAPARRPSVADGLRGRPVIGCAGRPPGACACPPCCGQAGYHDPGRHHLAAFSHRGLAARAAHAAVHAAALAGPAAARPCRAAPRPCACSLEDFPSVEALVRTRRAFVASTRSERIHRTEREPAVMPTGAPEQPNSSAMLNRPLTRRRLAPPHVDGLVEEAFTVTGWV